MVAGLSNTMPVESLTSIQPMTLLHAPVVDHVTKMSLGLS